MGVSHLIGAQADDVHSHLPLLRSMCVVSCIVVQASRDTGVGQEHSQTVLYHSHSGYEDSLGAVTSGGMMDARGAHLRTAAAQEPEMTHPIRCVSQSRPSEFQKVL